MRAISLWQPWASAMFVPRADFPAQMLKTFETRSWRPSVNALRPGELLAIHAAKTQQDPDTRERLSDWWRERVVGCGFAEQFAAAGWGGWYELPFGAIIGYGRFVGAFPTGKLLANAAADGVEQHFGNFGPLRFGWQMQSMKRLPHPISCTGRQGLFHVSIDL